jgi:hypothetical protein
VIGDGAYDRRRRYSAILARQAIPIIPIRKNGQLWKDGSPSAHVRKDTLRAT